MWTVDVQLERSSPWTNLGSQHPTSTAAWKYLTFLRITGSVPDNYYAACVRRT